MHTLTRNALNASALSILMILSFSCSEDPIDPVNGVDGTNGFNALVDIQDIAAGEDCTNGGVKISVGQDSNQNGSLDESEIQSVSFVCNGSAGGNGSDGLNLVARTSPENPGSNCEQGGTLVEIGIDQNANNSLDDSEIQSSFYVCNGADGADGNDGADGSDGLTSLIRVSSSTSCENGGITIELGLDSNQDGSLNNDEVNATYDICNGADGSNGSNGSDGYTTLSNVVSEAAGSNCSNGGLKIQLGLDTNRNGTLDDDEVISENYVCNGANGSDGSDGTDGSDGSDGISSIIRVTSEDPGANCENGGLMIEIGMDDVTADGELHNEEVDYTYFVCNGADGNDGTNGNDGSDGLNSLIKTTTEEPGANCLTGGIQIEIGLDNDNDGVLDDDEVIGTPVYVCNGLNGTNGVDGSDGKSVFVTSESDRSCTNGGVILTFGYDNNNDGDLQDTEDEVLVSQSVCNGEDGADGSNGLNSIIRITTEDPGLNCSNGGTLVEVGIDDNGNNNLDDDPDEVDASFYVCNGADGESISMTSSYSAALCSGNGGRTLTFGYDFDNNGTIDDVLQTFVVCDGADGSNGSDGNSDGVYEFYFYNGVSIYNGVSVYNGASDVYIDENEARAGNNFNGKNLAAKSGDASAMFAILKFSGLEDILRTTDDFEVLEAGLYLHADSSGGSGENYVGVKALNSIGSIFDQSAATFNSPDGKVSWTKGSFNINEDAGSSFMDMFKLPNSLSFQGIVPLQLNRSIVDTWISSPENNYGMVLQMASNSNTKIIAFTDSENEDKYLRPVLYIKILDNKAGGRAASLSDNEYKNRWKDLNYEQKIAPLKNRK